MIKGYFGVFALGVSVLCAAGCGGGGDSDGDPASEVKARSRALISRIVQEDARGVTEFVSNAFLTENETNRTEGEQYLREAFQDFEIVKIEPLEGETFQVSADQQTVHQAGQVRATVRERATGEDDTGVYGGVAVWVKEEGQWRVRDLILPEGLDDGGEDGGEEEEGEAFSRQRAGTADRHLRRLLPRRGK